MRFLKKKGAAVIVGSAPMAICVIVGAVAGAIMDAAVITLVFGMQTGIAGAVLVLLIVAVSVFLGWLIGLAQGIRK